MTRDEAESKLMIYPNDQHRCGKPTDGGYFDCGELGICYIHWHHQMWWYWWIKVEPAPWRVEVMVK